MEEENNTPMSDRSHKILIKILGEFETKIDEAGEGDTGEATKGIVREFGLEPEELAYIALSTCAFFTHERIDMLRGVQVALIVGMMLGRELNDHLREDLDKELGDIR